MSDLAQGYSASLILSPGEAYRVSTGGVATVTPAYGAPVVTTTITAQSLQFGPYGAHAKLEVVAVTGKASYGLVQKYVVEYDPETGLQSAGGTPLVSGAGIVIGTAAPNNADGRPDDTIYIQTTT